MPRRRVIVLGSTGSIGTQTLDVARHLAGEHAIEIVGLAAGSNGDLLAEQARELGLGSDALALESESAACDADPSLRGPSAAEQLVRTLECDLVVAAIVGVAGLGATLAAVELGRDVALANKETLVAAGGLVTRTAQRTGATLLPVDSEHSAIWQALGLDRVPPMPLPESVSRVILTASGGALRDWTKNRLKRARPEDVLNHPVWNMGRKVTADTASLTNKAFEVLEAHWLFGVPAQQLEVLIHRQSVVHSLVEFADASVMAQLGTPDMRTPIQVALTAPNHAPGRAQRLDFSTLTRLDFAQPDLNRFPSLALAWACMDADTQLGEPSGAGAAFNAANEIAVDAFFAGTIDFPTISTIAARAVDAFKGRAVPDLEAVFAVDAEARELAQEIAGATA